MVNINKIGKLQTDNMLWLQDLLMNIQKRLKEKFKKKIKCLILYGSWAKKTQREDSDIDLLVLFDKVDSGIKNAIYEIERNIESPKNITLIPASVEDFQKEKIPLFTAIKNEGKIIWGHADFTINYEPPENKYAEYLKKSKKVETQKVQMAEDILKRHPDYNTVNLCFVASKHAIQMALAMKGLGYSSKVAVLLPLAKKHLGKDVTEKFKKIFDLYVRSEYGVESLMKNETKLAVEYAKEILKVYDLFE